MRCRTVTSIIILALTIFVAPLFAEALRPTKILRIGVLQGGLARDYVPSVNPLCQGLQDLDYLRARP